MISETDLSRDFMNLGLGAGSHVVVHSALSRVGRIDGGAQAMLRALLGVLGPEGTILVPAFSYCFSGREEAEPFDAANTPGFRTGVFAETVRIHPDAVRSRHPTHSVAAVGARAAEFTAGHERVAALGPGSPMHKAAMAGARILLIGVTHTANSSVHIAEVLAGVPYSQTPFRESWGTTAKVLDERGRVKEVPLVPDTPGCSANFDVLDASLRKAGLVRDGKVGRAPAQSIDARGLLDTACELLRKEPGALLCHRPECEACTRRRKLLIQAG